MGLFDDDDDVDEPIQRTRGPGSGAVRQDKARVASLFGEDDEDDDDDDLERMCVTLVLHRSFSSSLVSLHLPDGMNMM